MGTVEKEETQYKKKMKVDQEENPCNKIVGQEGSPCNKTVDQEETQYKKTVDQDDHPYVKIKMNLYKEEMISEENLLWKKVSLNTLKMNPSKMVDLEGNLSVRIMYHEGNP